MRITLKPLPTRTQADTLGKPPEALGAEDFEVDGLKGKVKEHYRFRRGQTVRVVVRDVNPFLYAYTIATENEQIVQEPSPITFFNLAFQALGVTLPDTSLKFNLFADPGAFGGIRSCPEIVDGVNVSRFRDSVHVALERFDDKRGVLKLAFGTLSANAHTHRDTFERQLLEARNPAINARSVKQFANLADTALSHFVASTRNAADVVTPLVERAAADVRAAQLASKALPDKYATLCPILATKLSQAEAALTSGSEQLDKVRTTHAAAQAALLSFRTTANDPASYYAIKMLKRYDAPTDVTVTVSRRPVAARMFADAVQALQSLAGGAPAARTATSNTSATPAVTNTITVTVPPSPVNNSGGQSDAGTKSDPPATLLAAHRLTFGGRGRFSISAGVLLSTLADPRFAATQRRIQPVPGQSTDTSEFILTLSDSGRFRMIPAITLNMLAFPFGEHLRDGLLAVLGTGVQGTGGSPNLGWYLGGGVSAFESRFMFTVGTYVGRVQHLADLRLGQRLPTASVPSHTKLRADWTSGVMFRLY